MKGRKKRTPKKRAPSHRDPHGDTETTDNVVRPNEFPDISVNEYGQPGGDDIMFNAGGDADDPSRWEYQSEYVHNPFGAGPSGVNNQRGERDTGFFDPGNSALKILLNMYIIFLMQVLPVSIIKEVNKTRLFLIREILHLKILLNSSSGQTLHANMIALTVKF